MNQLLRTKWKRCFDVYDVSGDGVLSVADLEVAARRVGVARHHRPGSSEAAQLESAFHRVWELLLAPMDADGDGKISLQEWIGGFEQGLTGEPESYRNAVGPAADSFFDLADPNDDNRMTAAEHNLLVRHGWGLTEDFARRSFEQMDVDHIGYLTRAQFQDRSFEFLCSTDPQAPGNWFLGPLDEPLVRAESWLVDAE